MSTVIDLVDVIKVFPGANSPAIDGLSLRVSQGELVVLVGPSGCGKTTTLKMINRLIEPTSGSILVGGEDSRLIEPHELRRSIGYVIQQVGLFPHRTIEQNIATVPRLLGWRESDIEHRVNELAALVGLDGELLGRYPAELSGGQQQRVGVARALAADPPILLMDEPFGAVDPIVRGHLQEEFRALQQRLAKTVLFVTHDIDEALFLGDRVAILNVGGVLEQYDTPENILTSPSSAFVEEFLGGERGLRRLALRKVSDARIVPGPVVSIHGDVDAAFEVMRTHGTDWVGLLDGDRLLGWISEDAVGQSWEGVSPLDFAVTLEPTASLRDALDAVVRGRSRLAVVVDGVRYVGMLDLDSIAAEITE